jgi:YbbR domain-containing protein
VIRDFFRNHVFHNLWLKLVALALALLLWWAVGHDPTVEAVITAPLEFHHAPENLEMSVEGATEVAVRVRGPERTVRGLSPADLQATVDLSGAHAGERTFDLTAKQVHVPETVEVVQIEPSQVHIAFDRSSTRTVEVKPRVIGSLVTGYHVTSVSADPSAINIVGPQHRVDEAGDAITDPVDASGVVGSATFITHAYVTDPLVRVQKPEPIRVTVTTAKNSKGESSR